MYDFLFDIHGDHLSISYRFRDIRLQSFRVWPLALTSEGHLGSKTFILFGSPYMTSYLTSMDTISLSRNVFEIFHFKIFMGWPWRLTSEGHLESKIFILFESPYTTSCLTLMNTISLSRTVLEIFDFRVFMVWPWPLNSGGHLRSKFFISMKSSCMTSYLTSMNTISLSRTVFEIFDSKVFRVWPWPLTSKGHLIQNFSYYSKAHIWLPIWLLWTPSLYLVPFSRYSTSKFSGFDLDLWPLEVIRGQEVLFHVKAHVWLPFWLLWTPFLYLVPFSRYSTPKFIGFDLDFWPLKVVWVRKFYTIRKPINDFLFDFYETSLYLVWLSRHSTSKFLKFDFDLWPQKVIWGQNILYHSKAHSLCFKQHGTPAQNRCSHSHWLPVQQRITYKIALITFNVRTFEQPSYLHSLLDN